MSSDPLQRSEDWDRLATAVAGVEAELARALKPFGLGLSDFRALRLLQRTDDGELRMQVLAGRLGLNQSSVSRLMDRLERAELAVRDECPADGRGIYAMLKPAGRRLVAKAEPPYEARLRALLAALPHDEPDATLRRLLTGDT